MGIPDLASVTDFMRSHAQVPPEQEIRPDMHLSKDLGMTQETVRGLLDQLGTKIRFPYDEKPDDHRNWFDLGLAHARSPELLAKDAEEKIDFGAPQTVQRFFQVVFQGYMDGDNFNDVGGLD